MGDNMRNEEIKVLIDLLGENEVVVYFVTKKGIGRTMYCTRDLQLIPENQQDGINDPKLNGDLIVAVYDFDNCDWRSFRKDAVFEYKVIAVDYDL